MVTNTGIGVGIGIPFRNNARGGDKPYLPPEIKDSLKAVVIAYGKTNNDSDRAIVKNLVDPDNPFVISNAAFKLNSGFGKYEVDFTVHDNQNVLVSPNKLVSIAGKEIISSISYTKLPKDVPSYKVKITGLNGEISYWYRNQDGSESRITITEDGIYQLPVSYNVEEGAGINNGFNGYSESSCTIEQIPSFEGAFVTDGIDDLITSTKTVQEMLGGSNECTVLSMIHQITDSTDGINKNNWLFASNSYLESRVEIGKKGKTGIYGYTSTDISNGQISNINTILGDKGDYTVYSKIESTGLDYFSVEGFQNEGIWYTSSLAWYWTIIANKVLTTDQINQVIAYFNLDRTLKPDILCNVKKQGITNENHAEFGDRLIDFSGNGRDIQLNSIAWDGDSGIGKYNYLNWKVNVTQGNKYARIVYYDSINGTYSANFKGITDLYKSYGLSIEIRVNRANTIDFHSIKEDCIYTVTPPDDTTSMDIRFGGENVYNASCNITITQIPSHAGALYLDGVNDFGKVTGMPIYKDYTFIIDRKFLNETFANQVCLASKSKVPVEGENGGAFIIDNISINAIINPYSFYKTTSLPKLNTFDKQIVFQTKYKYLGKDIAAGTATDTDTLWLGTFRDNDSRFANVAIYSLMSFPYSMSEFLIERQLKKHKLGTLYPDMVEFRPIVKSNSEYQVVYCYIDTLPAVVGNYYPINSKLRIAVTTKGKADEVISLTVNGVSLGTPSVNGNRFTFNGTLSDKSPQKINITIDEYIRYEDIVQPYPSLFTLIDYDTEEVYSWGSKLKVGARFKGNVVNLLPNMYEWQGDVLYNGEVLNWGINPGVVAKEMVFSWNMPFKYLIDNNEPKCILSPRLLRIPNSSYKILGYIPDISGHGNHGKINNSAYAEGSGVNEDGSYQLDGVDDFVTIPTLSSGGKQVLMKVNWSTEVAKGCLYDQRKNIDVYEFAIFNLNTNNTGVSVPAYQARNDGKTYIDGILNNNILVGDLKQVLHNITITNELVRNAGTVSPTIGKPIGSGYYTNMALYDFMLFDEISTDEEILNLNKYIGIEPKVELPPYYWDAYGKTNLDADKATIQQRGVAVGDYDITNYNHAYDKMSGYGGYKFAKFDNAIEWFAEDSSMVVNRNGYLITLKKVPNVAFWRFRNTTLKSLDNPLTFKVKCNKPIDVIFQVKFAKNNDVSIGYNYNIKEVTLVPNESTTIIVPSVSVSDIPEATSILFINVLFDNTSLSDNEEYTVEMLPLYPNGLVYDAITDYSENVNIPVFTDFTAIMKRKWLKNQGCPLIKGSKVYEGGNGNALLFEWDKAYNFVFYKRTDIMEGEVPENISFITPTNYNGNVITRGSGQDTNGICIAGDGNAGFANMVFYKLILYPKTIPLLQINFLKNLMEIDEIIDLNNPIFIKNE